MDALTAPVSAIGIVGVALFLLLLGLIFVLLIVSGGVALSTEVAGWWLGRQRSGGAVDAKSHCAEVARDLVAAPSPAFAHARRRDVAYVVDEESGEGDLGLRKGPPATITVPAPRAH